MITRSITLSASDGLHARPASELVRLAKSMAPTTVFIHNGVKKANAALMLSVLSLGLKNGSVIEVSAEGPDEAKALDAVCNLLESLR